LDLESADHREITVAWAQQVEIRSYADNETAADSPPRARPIAQPSKEGNFEINNL